MTSDTVFSPQDLLLIRHAKADTQGRLCGRSDVALSAEGRAALAALPQRPAPPARLVASPALRCIETAAGLWPGLAPETDDRLWEQDFGEWEGLSFDEVPDVGRLTRPELAGFAAPGGESFADLVDRIEPALTEIALGARTGGPVALVVHAGAIRAALSLALGSIPQGLTFEIAPLSLTRLRVLPDGGFSIVSVNGPIA